MTDFPYQNGTASVTTTPAKVVTVDPSNDGFIFQNRGPVDVYIGGASVTADDASTGGVIVHPGEKISVPTAGGSASWDLWAATDADTAVVSWLFV